MNNYFLLFFSAIISILILFGYFLNKKSNLLENKVYVSLIITNLFCILLEVFCNISTTGYLVEQKELLVRIFFMGLLEYGCLFTTYMALAATKSMKKSKSMLMRFLIIGEILLIPVIVLPMRINEMYYATGTVIDYMVFVAGIYLIINIGLMITNYKILKVKMVPIFLYMFFMIFVIEIYYTDYTISMMNSLNTFLGLLMYFMLDNPDIQMIASLELARTEAEKATRAKSDFLASMSHELRTPLNAIVGLSEDLASYQNQVPEEVREDTKDICNASQTLLEMISNILDINQIESESIEILAHPYNLKNEITKTCQKIETRIGNKDIQFHVHISDDIPFELIGDIGKIKEIIKNLLTNAIKYTEKGEIDLTIKCVNDTNKQISTLYISVMDTGRGIQPENIDRIFSKFERLEEDRNTNKEGTGLGLAITKSLVSMMGGKIKVKSQYGKGSKFTVMLPQSISRMEIPTISEALARTAKQIYVDQSSIPVNNHLYIGKKVLIVDDNPLNIKVAKKALASFRFEIDECYDGLECLKKCKNKTYDLILMDIMMPHLNGEEAFKELKKNSKFKTPVIAVTADANAGAREKYLKLGFSDYVSKPYTKEEMKEKLDVLFMNSILSSNQKIDRFKDVPAYIFGSMPEMDKNN